MDFFVTTSIPYVNSHPHLGHALEFVQADALVRWLRLCGHRVRFQTGTDDNAGKNVAAAKALGLPVRELVDANAARFAGLCAGLDIAYDTFVRTSAPAHHRGVERFWRALRAGDLGQHAYAGLYCLGCEDFLQPADLVQGVCPDHGTAPTPIAEQNWFFALSRHGADIAALLEAGRIRVQPAKRLTEVLNFLADLRDISVSRDQRRSDGWGIPVPGDPEQIVYVWIDALVNYLTGLGYGGPDDDGWREWWRPEVHRIHVIGKNVWKFHLAYWPGLLLSAGFPQPDEVIIHGFVTVDGRKISKTLGNGLDPSETIAKFGAEALRWALLREPAFDDFNLGEAVIVRRHHADLSGGFGNLERRLTTLCARHGIAGCTGTPPPAPDGYHAAWEARAHDRAAAILIGAVATLNQDIDRHQPWKAPVGDPGVAVSLREWRDRLQGIAWWLQPFLPETGAEIVRRLSAPVLSAGTPVIPRLPSQAA